MKNPLFRILILLFSITSLGLAQNALPEHPQPRPSQSKPSQYQPITGKERLAWFAQGTVGPQSLAIGLFTAAVGTAENSPKEYEGTWAGFGKRYGMRFTGVGTSNAMEAGLGAIWGEDPRYFRAVGQPFKSRVKNVISMTFYNTRRDGHRAPAYARFVAIPGSNFVSNTWRADSEATNADASLRTLYGFLSVMGGNAFSEFWPDVSKHVFHKRHTD